MKKIALLALFALAACSQAEEAEPAAEGAAAVETAVLAADGGTPYGTFEVTTAGGTVLNYVGNADGTFTATAPDGTTTTGTWTQDSTGLYCETEEGSSEPTCYTEEIDADGVWTSTSTTDPEDKSTIVRID